MKNSSVYISIAIVSSIFTWAIITVPSSNNKQLLQLTSQLSVLSSRLNELNFAYAEMTNKFDFYENTQLASTEMPNNSTTTVSDISNSATICLPEAYDTKALQAVLSEGGSDVARQSGQSQPSSPKMVIVKPTVEQNQTYEVFLARLEDPAYVSSLNINELASSFELQALPEIMQMSILSKAVGKYNNGEVSEETFMYATP